jgi:hypothetical protein
MHPTMPDPWGANLRPRMELKTIVVLEGDQTGQELSRRRCASSPPT